jgi:hypothetical protein
MADKRTHFGRAGEFFAMSELLLRGWNVAVPVVDVGDDVFVIDDNDKTTRRLQVKSAEAALVSGGQSQTQKPRFRAKFSLSNAQLKSAQQIELIYMLLFRCAGDPRWRYLVIPRAKLAAIRNAYVEAALQQPDAAVLPDADAKNPQLVISFDGLSVTGWRASLTSYFEQWPEELPAVDSGPGRVGASSEADETTESVEAPDQ